MSLSKPARSLCSIGRTMNTYFCVEENSRPVLKFRFYQILSLLLFCYCLLFAVVVPKIGFLCVALPGTDPRDQAGLRLTDSTWLCFPRAGIKRVHHHRLARRHFLNQVSLFTLGFGSQEANKNTGDYFWSQISEVTSISGYLKIKTWPARWLGGERCLLTDLSLIARSRVKVCWRPLQAMCGQRDYFACGEETQVGTIFAGTGSKTSRVWIWGLFFSHT